MLPVSLFIVACIVFLTDFLRTGMWASMIWLFLQGIVVFLFIIRKVAVPQSHRP